MSDTVKKVEEGLDYIKEQNPSRQRYYSAIIGFVLGIIVTTAYFVFF